MSRIIMLIPTSTNTGLTNVSLGVIRAMEQKGFHLNFFKPIAQDSTDNTIPDLTTAILQANSQIPTLTPLPMSHVETLISNHQQDVLLEEIITAYHSNIKAADVVVIEGLSPTDKHQFANTLNYDIAKALNAEIVFVTSLETEARAEQFNEHIEIVRASFGGSENQNIIGLLVNKLNAPTSEQNCTHPDLSKMFGGEKDPAEVALKASQIVANSSIPVLGCIPWSLDIIAPRAIDMANHLNARIINPGDIHTRRIKSVTFCARSVPNMIELFTPGALLVTSADRPDVLVAAALAAMNGVEIGALLLTGGYDIAPSIATLCERAFKTGLPVFTVATNTWQTSLNLQNFNPEVPADDHERVELVQDFIASHINGAWIDSLKSSTQPSRQLSPAAFRYQLTEMARQAAKRIILPEGDEPRTIKAATLCAERGIAECVLLGKEDEIKRVATAQGVHLGAGITVIDPDQVREHYVARLVELRKNKGMTDVVAREQLSDNVVLATLMLEQNEVDGLVSGAIHTTANTIRPALQLIKTAPGSSIVSSIFFMLLPEQVLVYGDCAINPDPSAKQLSEIAIQSAESALAFGIEPRVAMISYSTGNSGSGSDVDKVREATRLAQEKRPDLLIDGPMQYDAAVMADVAKSKAPDSPVAGKATVFIFPDLNTGNTTYKAVQRSAGLVSIGPMLQGMRKPVNDLSRGALVDDIVYTIALTAIQANQH